MKALRKMYTNEDGVQMFHDLPIPEPAKGEVRTKNIYAALSWSGRIEKSHDYVYQ